MGTYLRIAEGVVAEPPLTTDAALGTFSVPDLVWVPMPAGQDVIEGWSAVETDGVWTFAPPAPPTPTLAQQAALMLATGCRITSTSAPALDATYPCDAQTQTGIMAETIALIQNGGTFLDGTTSVEFPDATGTMHTFTVAQFKAWNTALGAYVGALTKIAQTSNGTLPAQPVQIG